MMASHDVRAVRSSGAPVVRPLQVPIVTVGVVRVGSHEAIAFQQPQHLLEQQALEVASVSDVSVLSCV